MNCCACECRCRVTPGSIGNVESWRCHLHGEAECQCAAACADDAEVSR
jgi:hypothetical protein